jgi:hypothetical protein
MNKPKASQKEPIDLFNTASLHLVVLLQNQDIISPNLSSIERCCRGEKVWRNPPASRDWCDPQTKTRFEKGAETKPLLQF